MQVKTQLSHSSSWEWWKDYDADNCIGAGFFIFAGSLEKEYWQSPLSAVNSSFVRLKHSYLTVPVRNQIAKCICSNFKMYLSNCKMYLFKFQKVFVRIAKCICPNFGMYCPLRILSADDIAIFYLIEYCTLLLLFHLHIAIANQKMDSYITEDEKIDYSNRSHRKSQNIKIDLNIAIVSICTLL